MTRVLLKKQMMEVFSWLYRDNKKGTNRSKAGIIGYSVLYLCLFAVVGGRLFYDGVYHGAADHHGLRLAVFRHHGSDHHLYGGGGQCL